MKMAAAYEDKEDRLGYAQLSMDANRVRSQFLLLQDEGNQCVGLAPARL